MRTRTAPVALTIVVGWLVAAGLAGFRLHQTGGVFGEAVDLWPSIASQALLGLPWPLAAALAWWSAGQWPIRRGEVLRPFTLQVAFGIAVAVSAQIMASAASLLLPVGLRPLDPWARLPELLTWRGPPALLVYLVLAAVCLVIRHDGSQDVPGAGTDEDP